MVGWKGKSSLRCYVARTDRVHYLRLVRADTSKYLKNKFQATATPALPNQEGNEEKKSAVENGEENIVEEVVQVEPQAAEDKMETE